MDCTGTTNCGCGCCGGLGTRTPHGEDNLPGLPTIAYRAGTWASFKSSMQTRLSSSDFPSLSGLKTRASDDFTMALVDAGAIVLDILTFYTERLANESYLRTAGQMRSLIELSRLIGYQPSPGVAASTSVAFTLKAAPGLAANPATPAITIPSGTQIQSVPAQGQTPQTFETSSEIQAKADWNALAVQTSLPWMPPGGNLIYFDGTSTQLQQGDSLLILGVDRENWHASSPSDTSAPSEQWDVVVVNSVQVDTVRNLTKVTWTRRLGHQSGLSGSSWTTAKVFAFRQKANLFGHNAPNPALFVNTTAYNQNPQGTGQALTSLPLIISVFQNPSRTVTIFSWFNYFIADSDHIDLDSTYPKIVSGSWFALTVGGTTDGVAQLYRADRVSAVSRADFAVSGKVTELSADFHDPIISLFGLTLTNVLAHSEELVVADQPLDSPLYGTSVDLREVRPDLLKARLIAITGKRQKLRVQKVSGLDFNPAEDPTSVRLRSGEVVTLLDPAPLPLNADGTIPIASDWFSNPGSMTLYVEDSTGRPGKITANLSDFALAPSTSKDPTVSECALVSSVLGSSATTPPSRPHTQILIQTNLVNCYDRATTTVNANVGLATQGQSVSEVLGGGNAAIANQSFTLRQSPLTYIQAATPTGRQSTLEIRANASVWNEVPTLYNHAASERVFTTLNQSGKTTIRFGDGVEGATLPTGQNNIHARYRVGLGSSGNVGPDALTTLMDRPLGVSGVTNPQAATGGQDADSIDDTRSKAPLTVLTLGRAVSITDYRDYAAGFAGISKAHAIWIPSGPGRGVFLTVAGVNGTALPDGNLTLTQLVTSLRSYGNPLIPITARSFVETLFRIVAQVAYDPTYDAAAVEADIRSTLSNAFSFANRTFGQGVSTDEVASVIQGVKGVVAVNVLRVLAWASSTAGDIAGMRGGFSIANLNDWLSQSVFVPREHPVGLARICPYLPVPSLSLIPRPAEILVLHPDPRYVYLGVMS
jgi:hypothetical protein